MPTAHDRFVSSLRPRKLNNMERLKRGVWWSKRDGKSVALRGDMELSPQLSYIAISAGGQLLRTLLWARSPVCGQDTSPQWLNVATRRSSAHL